MNMWCVHYPDHIALLSAVLVETFDDVLWCSDCRFFWCMCPCRWPVCVEHNARAFPFLGASQEGVKRAAAKRPPCGVVPSQGSSCPEPREGGHRPSSLELRRSLVVS